MRSRLGWTLWVGVATVALGLVGPVFAQGGGGRQRQADRVVGTVANITATSLTVKPMGRRDATPEPVEVALKDDTAYGSLAEAKAADMAADNLVMALSEGEGDAAQVKGVVFYAGDNKNGPRLVGSAAGVVGMMMMRGRGAAGGGGGARPQPPKPTTGKFKSVEGGKLVLTTKDGDVTLKLADDAIVRKVVDNKREDVKAGAGVTVLYPAGYKDGDPKVAAAVLLMPPRQGGRPPRA